jgi:hypothetical protein
VYSSCCKSLPCVSPRAFNLSLQAAKINTNLSGEKPLIRQVSAEKDCFRQHSTASSPEADKSRFDCYFFLNEL